MNVLVVINHNELYLGVVKYRIGSEMPMVHFIGEIKVCKVAGNELFFQKSISLTWAIVAGNTSYIHKWNH